jgi:hypothetical protein
MDGIRSVVEGINKELMNIRGHTLGGLIKATALIRHETEHGAVKTPVDLGNLRASWFVVSSKGSIVRGGGAGHTPEGMSKSFKGPNAESIAKGHTGMLKEMQGKVNILSNIYKGPFVIMGYSANYTFYVHEMIGVVGYKSKENPRGWSRSGSGPKWFEAALKKHRNNIVKIVGSNQKIV